MLSIGQMAKRFGLSRSTLLYYDSIGLLTASERTPANYRLYSEADVARMELIALYRRAGLPLSDIAQILASGESSLTEALETRLRLLDKEIRDRQRQQGLVLELLRGRGTAPAGSLDKDGWIEILSAAGLSDADMQRWHIEFERLAPEEHREFLQGLGMPDDEVSRVRLWAQAQLAEGSPGAESDDRV